MRCFQLVHWINQELNCKQLCPHTNLLPRIRILAFYFFFSGDFAVLKYFVFHQWIKKGEDKWAVETRVFHATWTDIRHSEM